MQGHGEEKEKGESEKVDQEHHTMHGIVESCQKLADKAASTTITIVIIKLTSRHNYEFYWPPQLIFLSMWSIREWIIFRGVVFRNPIL
jgi:hypothetical protein